MNLNAKEWGRGYFRSLWQRPTTADLLSICCGSCMCGGIHLLAFVAEAPVYCCCRLYRLGRLPRCLAFYRFHAFRSVRLRHAGCALEHVNTSLGLKQHTGLTSLAVRRSPERRTISQIPPRMMTNRQLSHRRGCRKHSSGTRDLSSARLETIHNIFICLRARSGFSRQGREDARSELRDRLTGSASGLIFLNNQTEQKPANSDPLCILRLGQIESSRAKVVANDMRSHVVRSWGYVSVLQQNYTIYSMWA